MTEYMSALVPSASSVKDALPWITQGIGLAGSATTLAGTDQAAAAAVAGYNQAGTAALTTGQYNAGVQEARAQNALTAAAANAGGAHRTNAT